MKVVVTGGGTGGHIYPALAIIEGVKANFPNVKIIYIGTTTKMESKLIPDLGIEYIGIEMRGVNRKNIFANFKLLYLLFKNNLRLKRLYKEVNPSIVIGTGGYVTVPVIKAAAKSNIPTLIFDADYNFGMATKYLSKHVDKICSGYKQKDENVIYTGNPRGQYSARRIQKRSSEFVFFVFGSLGSDTVNEFFKEFFNRNEINYQAVYVTGKGKYEDFIQGFNNNNVEVLEYVEDMSSYLSRAKYVVCRSGATFVSELSACTIPAIYIPSPYVANNEQVYNVEELVKNKCSLMILEKDLVEDNFRSLQDEMDSNYEKYVANLSEYAINNSCDLIINEIRGLINE